MTCTTGCAVIGTVDAFVEALKMEPANLPHLSFTSTDLGENAGGAVDDTSSPWKSDVPSTEGTNAVEVDIIDSVTSIAAVVS